MSEPDRKLDRPVDGRGDHLRSLPPAFYARPSFASRGAIGDWWTLLHPPYTLWHLSYVVDRSVSRRSGRRRPD